MSVKKLKNITHVTGLTCLSLYYSRFLLRIFNKEYKETDYEIKEGNVK